ncbi:hypothetical protein AB6E53_06750 [Vibrio breoganii]
MDKTALPNSLAKIKRWNSSLSGSLLAMRPNTATQTHTTNSLPRYTKTNINSTNVVATPSLSQLDDGTLWFDTSSVTFAFAPINNHNATTTLASPASFVVRGTTANNVTVTNTPNQVDGWAQITATHPDGTVVNVGRVWARYTGRTTDWDAWYGTGEIREILFEHQTANSAYPIFAVANTVPLGYSNTGSFPGSGISSHVANGVVDMTVVIKNRW